VRADPDPDPDPAPDPAAPAGPRWWAVLGVVAVGGVVGAEARYGVAVLLPHAPGAWPWATLLTNASGCLLIGVLVVLVTERFRAHPLARPLLGVGVLGGYTTFSTYTVDTVLGAAAGRALPAVLYAVLTPAVALVAVTVGVALTRRLVPARGPA
jgi:fluoride exporter